MDVVADVTGRDPRVVERLAGEIQQLPQVLESARVSLAQGQFRIPGKRNPGLVFPIVSLDGRFGRSMNRPKILQGRMYDPAVSDEIVPSFAIANALGLHVGQTVQLRYGGFLTNGPLLPRGQRPGPVTMHVVGIGAIPGMFAPLAGGYLPGILLSTGFVRAHPTYV